MEATIKRVLSFASMLVVIPLYLGFVVCIVMFLFWFFPGGGWLEILSTIVSTAENIFKYDWKLAEVVLMLVVFFLVIRKR